MAKQSKQTPEQIIKNSIFEYLRWRGVFCWSNKSIGVWDPTRRCYRKNNSKYDINGVSDILGIYKTRFLAIEVKTRRGKATPEQQEFITRVKMSGGVALVARSVKDVEDALKACDLWEESRNTILFSA